MDDASGAPAPPGSAGAGAVVGRRWRFAFVVIAGLLAAAYLGKGFHAALTSVGGDLTRRWVEQRVRDPRAESLRRRRSRLG